MKIIAALSLVMILSLVEVFGEEALYGTNSHVGVGQIYVPINAVTFAAGSGTVSISLKTGKVDIKGVTLDEAAIGFWKAIEKMYPLKKDKD